MDSEERQTDSKRPEPIQKTSALPVVVFLIGIAALVLLAVIPSVAGYNAFQRGRTYGGDTGNPLVIPLLIIELVVLSLLCGPIGKRRLGCFVEILLLLIPIHVWVFYRSGANYSDAQTRSRISRMRSDSRLIADAIESYRSNSSRYPPDLQVLARRNPPGRSEPYLASLPEDPFTPGVHPRYFASDNDATSGWIVWSPGPDRRFDIEAGNDLRAALLHLAENQTSGQTANPGFRGSQWLADRVYDPTNGELSGGDIVRWGW